MSLHQSLLPPSDLKSDFSPSLSPDTKIAVRDPRIINVESYLTRLNLQADEYERALVLIVSAINALGNAELPSSFLWFLTTDVAEVGLDVNDLTMTYRPQEAVASFTGTMVLTALITLWGGRTFYRDEKTEIEESVQTIQEEENQFEENTQQFLFEAMRLRVLCKDSKEFEGKISPLLPANPLREFHKAFFFEDIEQSYNVFCGLDSKDLSGTKKKIVNSDYAFDEKFREEVIKKIMEHNNLALASKTYFSLPLISGNTARAVNVGMLGGLLMAGTLFPAWWAIHSLVVSSEIDRWSSLKAFWEISMSLIVMGFGIGFFMGKHEHTQSRRESLAEGLHSLNADLRIAEKAVRQTNLKICQANKSLDSSKAKIIGRVGVLAPPRGNEDKPSLKKSNSMPCLSS